MSGEEDLTFRGLPGIRDRAELRQHVLANGCFDRQHNLEIYRDWFADAPRYLFRAVNRRYGIARRVVCDVGAAYGQNLVFCAPGSYGIEIVDDKTRFARAIGLQAYTRDIHDQDVSDLPRADVVWCSAVLEHVTSPHVFLRKLAMLLKPGGLLALYVPTVPLIPAFKRLPRVGQYFNGHGAGDHINFFTPQTLAWSCERGGFATLDVSPFYPGPMALLNHLPLAQQVVSGCVYVGRKIEGWEYPRKAQRRAADNQAGFVALSSPVAAVDERAE